MLQAVDDAVQKHAAWRMPNDFLDRMMMLAFKLRCPGKQCDRFDFDPLPCFDFDWLVPAWSMYDIAARFQHHSEFTGAVLSAFAFGDLFLVELVENPDTFADYAFGVIGAHNFAA